MICEPNSDGYHFDSIDAEEGRLDQLLASRGGYGCQFDNDPEFHYLMGRRIKRVTGAWRRIRRREHLPDEPLLRVRPNSPGIREVHLSAESEADELDLS